MNKKFFLLSCLLLVGVLTTFAQPVVQFVKVTVTPNSSNWKYKTSENVKFDIGITMNNVPIENAKIRYELSQDMMPTFEKKEMVLTNGKTTIKGGTLSTPGFLRCMVFVTYEGKDYTGLATAGFNPESIKPTVGYPSDFLEFWNKAKAENAKIPIDPKLTLLPERCTDKVNVYHVGIQNYTLGSRIYGILSVPKAEGKYPAILLVPGAGVRSFPGDIQTAEAGVITLEIGIHGIPVNMADAIYADLKATALSDYYYSNWDNRDKVYYKRVYLGCVRAIDYIYSLKAFDGVNVAVRGGSQGGALAIVTAGLDSRIKALVSFYPALSDMTGFLSNRAGGWPQQFKNCKDTKCVLDEKVKVAGYYDVVNFARQVKVPGFYTFGYNDMVCPPTSVYSSVNVINAPKEVFIVPESEHWNYPEQWRKSYNFLMKMIKK